VRLGPISIEFGSGDDGRAYDHIPDQDVDRSPSSSVRGADADYQRSVVDPWEIDDPPELQGTDRFYTYSTMRRSDPAVKSNLWLYKLLMKTADWPVEPASEDGIDKEIAEGIAANFGLNGHDGWLDLPWPKSITQASLCLDYGRMDEEIIWGDPIPWSARDGGEPRIIRPINRLAPRLPQTIQELKIDPLTGKTMWLRQNLPQTQPIPGDKLASYVIDQEGSNPYGTSLLRAMFGSWKLKRNMMISYGIGFDRWASGLPVIRYPASMGNKGHNEATAIGRNVRTHERAYVVLKGMEGEEGAFGFDIKQGQVIDPTSMLRYYDSQISAAALAQAMGLAHTSETGSRALGEVQIEPLYMAIQSIADDLADARRKQVFRRWVDVNYGPEFDVPKLNPSKIQAQSLVTLARILADLTSAGFNFTDFETQNTLRRLAELPELPEELLTAIQAANEAGAGVEPFVPQEGASVVPSVPGAESLPGGIPA
jgi:hypothetical protein